MKLNRDGFSYFCLGGEKISGVVVLALLFALAVGMSCQVWGSCKVKENCTN